MKGCATLMELSDKLKHKKNKSELCVRILFLMLMFAAAGKIWLIGYDMDEQYAYAIAFRLLKGDFFLKEMWEPHQTSAILEALIMAGYLKLFGSTGIVLFSRLVGMIIHLSLMFCLYHYLKTRINETYAFVTVGIIAFSIPKLMYTTDFSNQLMWFELIYILALSMYYGGETRKKIYLVIAGISLTLGTLAYPALIVLVPDSAYTVVRLRKDGKLLIKESICLATPCFAGLAAFMAILLAKMDFANLCTNLKLVLKDGSHSASLTEKLSINLNSLLTVLIFGIIYLIISLLIWLIFKNKLKKDIGQIIYILVTVCFIGQLIIWIFGKEYINFPRVEMFLATGFLLAEGITRKKNEEQTRDFLLFTVVPFAAFIGVSLLTNHPFLVSAPFLSYVLVGLALRTKKNNGESLQRAQKVCLYASLAIILFGNLFLIRTAGGERNTLIDKGTVIHNGPAKGVIADYVIAGRIKDDYDLITSAIPENSKVFYMGYDSDIYMYGNYEVCSPSTISTPTYNENTLKYFEINKNKKPDFIICEKVFENEANELFGEEYEEMCSNWYIRILTKKK